MTRLTTVIAFFSLVIVSCRSESKRSYDDNGDADTSRVEKLRRYSDTIDWTIFNRIIQTDASKCESFRKARTLLAVVENKKAVVETNNVDLFLKTESLSMWTCNLPKEITAQNIGDTVVVSASVFSTFGDERTWGEPTILYKVATKDSTNKHT